MSAPAPVVVDGLTKHYRGAAAVTDLSFQLEAGTVTGFLGPNGAGKSTTLRVLLGLARPTSGSARVFGTAYADLAAPAATVGAVLESDDLHPGRSGRAHLRALAFASGVPSERVDAILDRVGLADAAGRPVRTYSLGMRQRLGLAAALLGDPRLLVLDEPINGLDPVGVNWLRGLLRDFAAEGGTVLVASHVLAEVAQSVDRVLIIGAGRLLADQAVDESLTPRALEETYLRVITEVAS